MRLPTICLLFAGVFVLPAFAQRSSESIPILTEWVTDQTGSLSSAETQSLEQLVRTFERQTSNQVVVLIVPTTGEESIEEYTIRVGEKNKVGRKGRDNGVLLLIAKDDRRIRIEVGYGLEGVLTDALSDQIIRRVISPKFRQGDFAGGVRAGMDAIMRATQGEFTGEPRRGRNGVGTIAPLLIIAFLVFAVISQLYRSVRRTTVGPRRYYSSGPWWWGGGGFGGGGGGGWGGGGGGGFSGGGGSFGGGGASGSW